MAKDKKPRAPRTSKVDPDESPTARFKRLATARTGKALKAIAALGKLTGRNYERSDADVKKIIDALNGAVEVTKQKFAGKAEAATGFAL